MLRSRALQILNDAGLPFELIRAFASTFSGNSCCLKINNKLTRVFMVNRGTKEGGINSPRIFNTVYSQILKRLSISQFPSSVAEFDPRKVYFLLFADDLVLLSGNLTALEEMTNALDLALEDVGMKINSGKCKWLAYLPQAVNYQTLMVPHQLAINHGGVFLDNVDEFKYLGFTTSFDLSHKKHIQSRVALLSLAARLTGRLMRSLQITNFRSLRAYFYSLVGSQLYSLSVVSFPELDYDRAIKQFLQECFTLPSSFPMLIAKLFIQIDDLVMQAFNARVNFFQRILSGTNSNASLAAMSMDRGALYGRDRGWSASFEGLLEGLVDFPSLDLSSITEIDDFRSDLRTALSRRRAQRFATSSSSFVAEIFPSLSIPLSFSQHLNDLPLESIRIILIFFANMFQFTYFRSANLTCPFCQSNLTSVHFFVCTRVHQNQTCNWSLFINDFHTEEYTNALDRLFLVLQRWTIITNRFQPSFLNHVEEYFAVTDFRQRRRNTAGQLTTPVSF
jgi:hypothetical protein